MLSDNALSLATVYSVCDRSGWAEAVAALMLSPDNWSDNDPPL